MATVDTSRATVGNRSNFDNGQSPSRSADPQGMDAEIFEVTVNDLTTPDPRAPFDIAYLAGVDAFPIAKATVEKHPDAVTWLPLRSAHLYGLSVQFTVDGVDRTYEEMAGHGIVVRSAVTS